MSTLTREPVAIKALSLWQPWASLVALGVKTIETRSWYTGYRGPLAIHAAATTKGFDTLPGDCEGTTEGGWRYGYIGDYQAGYCYRTSDEGTRGQTFMVRDSEQPWQATVPEIEVPLGALVATCLLVDVVPIVENYNDTHGWPPPRRICILSHKDHWRGRADAIIVGGGHEKIERPVEQPYGDYSKGRFAWVLSDIVPIDPPIPARGRQQLWTWTPPEVAHNPEFTGTNEAGSLESGD